MEHFVSWILFQIHLVVFILTQRPSLYIFSCWVHNKLDFNCELALITFARVFNLWGLLAKYQSDKYTSAWNQLYFLDIITLYDWFWFVTPTGLQYIDTSIECLQKVCRRSSIGTKSHFVSLSILPLKKNNKERKKREKSG